MEGKVEVRRRSCYSRFSTPRLVELVRCPNCHQRWKLKWFDYITATVLPRNWVEFQKKMKEIKK